MYLVLILFCFIFVIVFHIIFYHQYHLPKYITEIEKIPGPKGVFFFGNIFRFYQLKTEEMLPHIIQEFRTWGSTLRYWYSGVAVVVTSEVEDVQISIKYRYFNEDEISSGKVNVLGLTSLILWLRSPLPKDKICELVQGDKKIQTILSSKLSYEKGIMYDHLKPWLGTGLLTSKGEKWKMMRKIITPTFHFSILLDYIQVFAKNSKIMVDLLSQIKNKKDCNLNNFITYCALDSICETSMGKCINSQITRCENEYVKAILRIGQIVVERLFSPFLYTNHMFNLSPLGRENSALLKILHGVTSKLIQERKQLHLCGPLGSNNEEKSSKNVPFLDLLIEKQKKFHFSDTDLRQEVDTVLMAGHDTTATALSWCLFELGYREDIQEKVYDELQKIFEGSDREPTYHDLMQMEYLKRVLQETLRLYPSVPVISRKFHVDVKLKNYRIPAYTDVVIVLYCLHRNPEIYPNPEMFDPDRFLPEMVKNRNPFAYVPFSAGSRNCLGQKYAMLQMLVISSYILRYYKVKTLNRKASVIPVPDVILRPNVQLKWELISRI